MQNVKRQLSNLLFLALFLIFSCEQVDLSKNESELSSLTLSTPPDAIILGPVPECPLSAGYADWDLTTLTLGTVKSYSIETFPGAIYKWTISGSGIQILGVDDSNTVTIKAVALSASVTLSVTRDANGGGTCGNAGVIKVVKSGGGVPTPTCSCPAPLIDDVLCVSGGHPYWRFQLSGYSSGDEIFWYGSHIAVMSGQGQSYVVANPDGTGGFTLYCRVTRTCSDGTKKTRIGYYQNVFGGSCDQGSTGFTGSCTGPILD